MSDKRNRDPLFDNYDDSVSTSGSRKDDRTGTFWLLIDRIAREKTLDDRPYIKAYRTTVRVVDPGTGEQEVGDETTHAFFKSQKHKFFEIETKRLVGCALALSREATDALTSEQVQHALLKGKLHGVVVEARCKVRDKKNDEGEDTTYTVVNYVRRVSAAELAKLPKKDIARFFPDGLPEDPEGMGSAGEDDDDLDVVPQKPKGRKPVADDDEEEERPRRKAKRPADDDEDE